MLVHALRGLRARSRLPRGRRGPLHGLERRLGRGGVARGRGRRVRPLAARALARRSPCSRTPSSTTTRRTPRGATCDATFRPSSRSRREPRSSGTGPSCSRSRRAGCRVVPFDAEPSSTRAARASCSTASPVELAVPGAHNARNAAAALTRRAARRRRPRGGGRRAARLRGRRPALRAARAHAGRRRVVDDYAHHPTEVAATLAAARDARSRRASSPSSSRTCYSRTPRQARRVRRRAGRRRPRRASSTSTRRASAPRTSRASPGCWSPGRPPTRPAARTVAWLPALRRRRALPARPAAGGRPVPHARGRRHRRARAGAPRRSVRPAAEPRRRSRRPLARRSSRSARSRRSGVPPAPEPRHAPGRPGADAASALALGWLWFRDSPFARRPRRLHHRDDLVGAGPGPRARCEAAARDEHAPRREDGAARRGRAVQLRRRRRVHADFPHELPSRSSSTARGHGRVGGRPVPATGGGLLLEGVRVRDLAGHRGERVGAARRPRAPTAALAALRVAAAAPPALRARAERVFWGARGMTLELRDGPELIFGSRGAPATSGWRRRAVLAEDSSAGAVYLDLRVPGRVAAGGVGPLSRSRRRPRPSSSIPQP